MEQMKTFSLDNGPTYEIVDGEARERLTDLETIVGADTGTFPIVDVDASTTLLEHSHYYRFGTVDGLILTLNGMEDAPGYLLEWQFEFIAAEGFSGLNVAPAISWVLEPYIVAGKRYLVSIDNNRIGVIACVEAPA